MLFKAKIIPKRKCQECALCWHQQKRNQQNDSTSFSFLVCLENIEKQKGIERSRKNRKITRLFAIWDKEITNINIDGILNTYRKIYEGFAEHDITPHASWKRKKREKMIFKPHRYWECVIFNWKIFHAFSNAFKANEERRFSFQCLDAAELGKIDDTNIRIWQIFSREWTFCYSM